MISIGERIRLSRQSSNLSVRALSERACVANADISRLESGLQTRPGAEKLMRIALALNVTLDWLACGRGEPLGITLEPSPPPNQGPSDRRRKA